MGGDEDGELVERIARGDARAFARLVERRSGRLMALAYRIIGERAQAEDVVQETFARAWVKAPNWRRGAGGAAFSTWMGRVAVNLAIDHVRKVVPLPLEAAPDPVDPAVPEDVKLAREDEAAALRRAVADLPERQRAAVALTYDLGLSNSEAAAALSTSVGALELLLVRARKTLRRALTEADHDT